MASKGGLFFWGMDHLIHCLKINVVCVCMYLLQDLESLGEGLEGRSGNPVALLFDTLLRPNTDIDDTHPSSIRWEYQPSKAVRHIVVGRGKPGGFWQFMDPHTKTLSLDRWLELPLYSFREWQLDQRKAESDHITDHMIDHSHVTSSVNDNGRVLSGEVARYYADYVTKMGLGGNFVDNTEISQINSLEKTFHSVSPLSPICCSSPPSSSSLLSPASPSGLCLTNEIMAPMLDKLADICSQISEPEDCGIGCCDQRRVSKHKWYLRGSVDGEKKICVFSQKLVLACGVYGEPRRLNVPGEKEIEFVTNRFSEFSRRLRCLSAAAPGTVLVVGAGLSAADAVLHALRTGAKVVHVFQEDPNNNNQKLIFSRMSKEVYPGYHRVYRLMQGLNEEEEGEDKPNYIRCAQSRISEFRARGFTVASPAHVEERWDDVGLGGVFLGSNADLGFLPKKLVERLGSSSSHEAINAKRNPVAVDPVSFVTEASPSLYAIGSLVGDNFVRFGVGSALGAAQHIIKECNRVT